MLNGEQNELMMNPYPGAQQSEMASLRLRRTSKGRSALKWLAIISGVLVAMLFGLLTLLLIGLETGPVGFMIGLIMAMLPVPLYVMLVLWLDRYESEPLWMLTTAFFWGAAVAVFIAIIINTFGQHFVGRAFGADLGKFSGLSFFAPVVEETAKALALFALYYWKPDEFDGLLDGIIYAAMVGLGFAMTENMLYYGRAALEGNVFAVFVARGMFAPYSHPLFTSMTGIGLGLASHSVRRWPRVVVPLAGLLLAIVLHSIWNTSLYLSERAENGLIALAMYFLIMVPIFFGVLLAVVLALRREGRILREHLLCDMHGGLLTPGEYERLCSIRGRMGASFEALTRKGYGGWRARTRFNSLASELAFHRSRVARRGHSRDGLDAEREAMYRQMLYELRGRVIFR